MKGFKLGALGVSIVAAGAVVLAGGGVALADAASHDSAPSCTSKPFDDVSTDSTFCADIQWMKDHNISFGYKDGKYKPNSDVTRQAIAAFTYRLANSDVIKGQSYESTLNCDPALCLDPAPGPEGKAGSSGWGWDSSANVPVTQLKTGHNYTFQVTTLQPKSDLKNKGTVTLTWDANDLAYVGHSGDSSANCSNGPGNTVTCSYTDLSNTSKSDGFTFKAKHVSPLTSVGVTAHVGEKTATGQFPVAVIK
jgi:hypothetical protein